MAKNVPNPANFYGTIIAGVIGLIGVSLVIKMIKDRRAEKSGDRAATDENVQIAQALNTAIHPGRTFLSGLFDSPDENEIFRLGNMIKNFDDVSTEYRNLYQENLSLELQDALGNNYPDFINSIKGVKSEANIISSSETIGLAKELYEEMDGWNLIRSTVPYTQLYRLSDTDFIAVIDAFNNSYDEDFATMLEGEYTQSIYETGGKLTGFADIKEKILKRYNSIF